MQGTLMSKRVLHPPPLSRSPSFHMKEAWGSASLWVFDMEGGFYAPLALVVLLHEKTP